MSDIKKIVIGYWNWSKVYAVEIYYHAVKMFKSVLQNILQI